LEAKVVSNYYLLLTGQYGKQTKVNIRLDLNAECAK
jgi:hypothetical protein